MREIEAGIEINACAVRVWQVLADVASYPGWNPFIRRVTGAFEEGCRPTLHIALAGPVQLDIRPLVFRDDPPRELRFRNRLLWGAFTGEHVFLIEERGGGGVNFVQRETFGGFLAPLLLATVLARTRRGFEAMNAALKRVAEGTAV